MLTPASTFFRSALVVSSLFLAACGAFKHDRDTSPVVTPAADNNEPCPQKMQTQFANLRNAQDQWYVSHGSPAPTEIDKAQLSVGTNGRAVMIVHGFISSPAAMQDLAAVLEKAGDTVYLPLLTGYGSDAHAANQASIGDWRQSVSDGVALLQLCYPSVAVVSHSLGGAIVTDEINQHGLTGIDNLVFLSPYYKLEQPWPALLVQALDGKVDDIDVPTLKNMTGIDPYSYLPITQPKPGEPQPFLPLRAMAKVIDLQKSFATLPPAPAAVQVPVMLAGSEADPVIDTDFAGLYIGHSYPGFSATIYAATEKIGHSIETPSLNPHFADLANSIQTHVMLNH